MEAAFFDLDKTVICRSSMMAFAPAFRREGLLSRRSVAKGAWNQMIYLYWGAGPERLARVQKSVLAVTTGWNRVEVRDLVDAELSRAIDPLVYQEALDAIAAHRREGRAVVLISAAPEEVVEPVGRRLQVDRVVASRASTDGKGHYTGQMESYAYGPAKAALIRELADQEGIDLAGSWAYSDSASDLPMLEAVGHPVVVNPDRALRRVAQMRGWPVEHYHVRAVPAGPSEPPSAGHQRVLVPASALALAVAVTTGGLAAWWVWRRPARAG